MANTYTQIYIQVVFAVQKADRDQQPAGSRSYADRPKAKRRTF
jgi:hypothetical protein